MSGKGSTSNVIAGLASFFIPGLGQLVQGRMLKALIHVVIGVIIWIMSLAMPSDACLKLLNIYHCL